MNIMQWIKRNSSTILSIFAAAGTVTTAVLAAKETPKALMAVYQAQGEKDGEQSKWAAVKAAAPFYIPALGAGTATLLCIFGANSLNHRQQASIVSAYALLEQAYREYREKNAAIFGEQADHIVEKAIKQEQDAPMKYALDETQTFYEEHYGKFFEKTMKDVLLAEYHLNRNMALGGSVTLNEFYDFLGLEHVADGDKLGWNLDEGPIYWGYQWIDFEHRYYVTDDGLTVCAIDMTFQPHEDEPDDGYKSPF